MAISFVLIWTGWIVATRQGVQSGLIPLYGAAVANLGATKAAAFGSLVPAWPTGVAIGVITLGVVLASGQGRRVLRWRKI